MALIGINQLLRLPLAILPELSQFSSPSSACRSYTSQFLETGSHRIGSKYKKVMFVEYEDGTFKKRKVSDQRDTGILGPVLKGEVGDQFTVRERFLVRGTGRVNLEASLLSFLLFPYSCLWFDMDSVLCPC